MRELKFRAWDIGHKSIEYCYDLYWFEENGVMQAENGKFKIMQYTGLKDKTGREIYEGDIIRFIWANNSEHIFVVKWDKYGTGYFPFTQDAHGGEGNNESVEQGEIIGNIYENPELVPKSA